MAGLHQADLHGICIPTDHQPAFADYLLTLAVVGEVTLPLFHTLDPLDRCKRSTQSVTVIYPAIYPTNACLAATSFATTRLISPPSLSSFQLSKLAQSEGESHALRLMNTDDHGSTDGSRRD